MLIEVAAACGTTDRETADSGGSFSEPPTRRGRQTVMQNADRHPDTHTSAHRGTHLTAMVKVETQEKTCTFMQTHMHVDREGAKPSMSNQIIHPVFRQTLRNTFKHTPVRSAVSSQVCVVPTRWRNLHLFGQCKKNLNYPCSIPSF